VTLLPTGYQKFSGRSQSKKSWSHLVYCIGSRHFIFVGIDFGRILLYKCACAQTLDDCETGAIKSLF